MTDMNIASFADRAEELFRKGYNCSQAVAAAFCDKTGMSEDDMFRLSCAFGGGFARKRYVCGALSGMSMVLGMLYSGTQPDAKVEMYAMTRELSDKFEKEFGSIVCSELLGTTVTHDDNPTPEERTEEYYKKRHCVDCVRYAAQILEEKLKQDNK